MIVDDSEDVCVLLKAIVEDVGFSCVSCASGDEALDSLRQGVAPIAIITDLMMPSMNGDELIMAIRRNEQYLGITLILSSADALAEDVAKRLNVAFIPKPMTRDALYLELSKLR